MEAHSQKLWFKRKTYGWGWTPVTWQGWLATLVYVVLLVACGAILDPNATSTDVAFTFFLPVLLLTIAFVKLAYKKGEKPRWQWGNKK
jgi:hypothetical protein